MWRSLAVLRFAIITEVFIYKHRAGTADVTTEYTHVRHRRSSHKYDVRKGLQCLTAVGPSSAVTKWELHIPLFCLVAGI